MLVAVCAVLAGCGDRETVAPTQATTTAPALGGIDRLAAEANRTERLLEDRVRALTEIDSLTDVSPRLKGLETELQNAAKAWKALSSRTTSLLCGTAWLKPFAAWRRRSPTRGRTWKTSTSAARSTPSGTSISATPRRRSQRSSASPVG